MNWESPILTHAVSNLRRKNPVDTRYGNCQWVLGAMWPGPGTGEFAWAMFHAGLSFLREITPFGMF